MRVPIAVVLVLPVHLALATVTVAQAPDDEVPPVPIAPRVEIGGGGGLMVAYPEVAIMASVPIGSGPAFEVAVGWMPRVIYDVEHALAQAQFRAPFRPHLRSRRSLLVGVTRVSAAKEKPFDGGFGAAKPLWCSRTPG